MYAITSETRQKSRETRISEDFIAWKVSKYRVFASPYFRAFRQNTEIYGENLCIQSEYRKIRTRRNSVFRHFSHSPCLFLDTHFADVLTYFGRDIFSFLWSLQGLEEYKRITILQISYGNAPNKGPRVYIKFFNFWGVVYSRNCLL